MKNDSIEKCGDTKVLEKDDEAPCWACKGTGKGKKKTALGKAIPSLENSLRKDAGGLPSMAGFQSLASNPTAKPQPGLGAKPAAPAPVKLPHHAFMNKLKAGLQAGKMPGAAPALAASPKAGPPPIPGLKG